MFGDTETLAAPAAAQPSMLAADPSRFRPSTDLVTGETTWLPSLNSGCRRAFILQGIDVLLVDDAQDIRVLVSTLLRGAGAHVHAVADATEALSALKAVKPTIIISDISMPDIDGYELMRTIRALPPREGGEIPAIALTAYSSEKDKQQALAAGFQAHLGKPVGTDKLLNLVAALVGHIPTIH